MQWFLILSVGIYISVFLLCQMLAMPLIVGGAPPRSPSCRDFCLLIDGGGPAVWKQSCSYCLHH